MPPDNDDDKIKKALKDFLATAGKNISDPVISGVKGIQKVLADMISQISSEKIADFFGQIDEGYRSIATSMGQGSAFVNDIKVNLANAATEMSVLGLTASESYQKAAQMNKDYVETTGKNARLSGNIFKQLQVSADVSGRTTKQISDSFIKAGISLEKTDETLSKALNQARAIGASGQIATQKMVDNLYQMDKFSFQGGIDGLAKMAAQATSMNVNMEKVLLKAEELLDPDKAIETAASLQRLGVVQSELLDPMRLMNLAQNDPAELQKQMVDLSKEFVHMNEQGKIEIMPGGREKLKLVAQSLGLTADELTRMAKSSFELDEKMKSIKFPDIATDEQKQMFANMAKMGKDGTYKIDIEGQEVGLEEAMQRALTDPEYMKQIEEAGKPKTMEDIAKEQLSLEKQQLSATQSIAEAVGGQLATSKNMLSIQGAYEKGLRTIGNTVRTSIKPGETRQAYDEIFNNSIKLVRDLAGKKETAMEDFMKNSTQSLKNVIDKDAGKKEFEKGRKELTEYTQNQPIFKLSEETLDAMGKAINGVISDGNDVLKVKGGTIKLLPQDSFIAGTGLEKMIDFAEGGGKKLIDNAKKLVVTASQSIEKGKTQGIETAKFENTKPSSNLPNTNVTEPKKETITGKIPPIEIILKFTSDFNTQPVAPQILAQIKNNTELQETLVAVIGQTISGQGIYS